MFITPLLINAERGCEFERGRRRSIWKGVERGRERGKRSNYIINSKKKKKEFNK